MSATSQLAGQSRSVLTIHWGPEDFPGTATVDAAIREACLSPVDEPVHYYAEYLETEEFPSETALLAFRDYLREKFAGRRIDVVIADSTPALRFALRYREELFPGVPVVFVAGSVPGLTINSAHAGVTGVLSDAPFAETLELALKLHPSVRRVYVVAQAPMSEGYDERVRTALQPFSQRVELTYIRERRFPVCWLPSKRSPGKAWSCTRGTRPRKPTVSSIRTTWHARSLEFPQARSTPRPICSSAREP